MTLAVKELMMMMSNIGVMYVLALSVPQDTINCVGGVQTLFPLLEQVDPNAPVPTPVEAPVTSELLGSSHSDSGEDWVVLGTSSCAGNGGLCVCVCICLSVSMIICVQV